MDIRKFAKNKYFWIAAMGVLGVLLLLLESKGAPNSEARTNEIHLYDAYEMAIEKKLEDFCACINGIDRVKAFVTLDTSAETVYAQNYTAGANQTVYEYLLFGTEAALPLYEVSPKIRGIAIVCDGGDAAYIQKMLTELISSATGVPTNKIKVIGYG